MNNHQKSTLKKNIIANIIETKKNIASYKRLTKPISPDNAIGRLTRMEAINSKAINDAALNRAQYKLSQLERTLDKVNHPDFGLCRECEEPIPFGRLMVLPETDLCVKCAENI